MGRADRKWVPGNRLQLLENGEHFYPAVFGAIENARREVLLETFILFEDKVGWQLHAVLLAAARRGVHVTVTVDDWGSPDLTPAFLDPLVEAGVAFRFFDPAHRLLRRFTALRRLHRKLVVVDGQVAYVGGINYSADHLGDFGPEAKQDYAVELLGPIVEDIHRFALRAIRPARLPAATPWLLRYLRAGWTEARVRRTAEMMPMGRDTAHMVISVRNEPHSTRETSATCGSSTKAAPATSRATRCSPPRRSPPWPATRPAMRPSGTRA